MMIVKIAVIMIAGKNIVKKTIFNTCVTELVTFLKPFDFTAEDVLTTSEQIDPIITPVTKNFDPISFQIESSTTPPFSEIIPTPKEATTNETFPIIPRTRCTGLRSSFFNNSEKLIKLISS